MKTYRFFIPVIGLMAATVAFGGFGLGDIVGKVTEKVTDPNAQKAVSGLSQEEEIRIGDSVSIEIAARYGGVWKNVVATQRVNLVGRTLARFAKRDGLDWRFAVLNSDGVNAFSAPNGRVFITKGLYKLLTSDDELAGVLAHEIAHVDLRHAAKIIAGKQGEKVGGQIAGEMLSDAAGKKFGDLPLVDQVVEQGTAAIANGLFTDGYGSGREYDADRTGYELAQATGFDPNGLRIALNKVEANTAHTKETFNTHPKTSDRLKKLPGGEEKKKGKGK